MAIAALSGGGGNGGKTPPPEPPQTPQTVEFTGASDFDPQGGDGEHPERTSLAFDGDPSTAWFTERYDAGFEGAAKTGVGLVLDTAESVTPATLNVQTGGGGWTFDVYGSDSRVPPTEGPFTSGGEETGAWGDPLASDVSAEESTEVELSAAGPVRHVLIWITNLEGTPKAEIYGAQLMS